MKFAEKVLLGTMYVAGIALLSGLISSAFGVSYSETISGLTLGALGFEVADRIVERKQP